jgi:hypothetical protein
MADDSVQELSPEELSELVRYGRIKRDRSRKPRPSGESKPRVVVSKEKSVPPVSSTKSKEPDPDWMKNQILQAERNLSTPEEKRRKAERFEESKF